MAVEIVLERDIRRNQFGPVKNDKQEDANTDGLVILEDRNSLPATGIEKDNLSPQKMKFPVSHPAPSTEEHNKPAMLRKPSVVVMNNLCWSRGTTKWR